jgi:hypothetical protein
MAKKKHSPNIVTKNTAIGLYLKGDFLSKLPKKKMITLFQVLRIINSLEFWLRLLLRIKNEKSDVFNFRNRMEIYFAMICSYKESTKEFSKELAKDLLEMNLSEAVCREISEYSDWHNNNRKQDEYLLVVDRVRNYLRSHLKSCIYDNSIKEGNMCNDLMIGYAIGNRVMDFVFIEPYTFEFQYIAEIVPEGTGKDKLNWIQDRSRDEINRFVKILKDSVREIFKGNSYKKLIDR